MDELDSRVYYGLKDAVRKAILNIIEDNLVWGEMPVILIDFHAWDVFYFDNKNNAEDYLVKKYSSWDEEPPNGEDENLIIYKYCTGDKEKYPSTYRNYLPYKEINDKKIYREKTFVEFEPELIINVSI